MAAESGEIVHAIYPTTESNGWRAPNSLLHHSIQRLASNPRTSRAHRRSLFPLDSTCQGAHARTGSSRFSSTSTAAASSPLLPFGAVAVSVLYRLAPENPIPAAFEDAWTSLKWIISESSDEWIKQYANLDRVYLAGDNIAHNTAVRFGGEKLEGMELSGMFLNCPFFWGKDPIGREVEFRDELIGDKVGLDRLLFYTCPSLSGLDETRNWGFWGASLRGGTGFVQG